MKDRIFYDLHLAGFACGGASYMDEFPGDPNNARVVIRAHLEDGFEFPMILDTGASWSILNPSLVRALGLPDTGLSQRLIVRSDEYEGRLLRAPLTLIAEEGTDLTFETTFFVPRLYPGERWVHPNFLGMSGALDRLRIAVDPSDNRFYFGLLGGREQG